VDELVMQHQPHAGTLAVWRDLLAPPLITRKVVSLLLAGLHAPLLIRVQALCAARISFSSARNRSVRSPRPADSTWAGGHRHCRLKPHLDL
jgi:hypothetical protein